MAGLVRNLAAKLVFKGDTKQYDRAVARIKRGNASLRADAQELARTAERTLAGLAIAAGAVGKAWADYEFGLAKVRKVSNLGAADMRALDKEMQKIITGAPDAATEVLRIAQNAAQLGIRGVKNIAKFTETMVKMRAATNISSEESTLAVARIMSLTKTSVSQVERLGSSIVRLGNTMPVMETEIVEHGIQVARLGGQYGLAAHDVLALGAAFAATGTRNVVSYSTMMEFFTRIEVAVAEGGKQFENFQAVLGMTGDEVKRVFADDPVEIFRIFINNLSQFGAKSNEVLRALGLNEKRVSAALNALAGRSDVLNNALVNSADAWEKNTDLAREYAIFSQTLTVSFLRMWNAVKLLAAMIGKQLFGGVNNVLDKMRDWAVNLAQNEEAIRGLIDTTKSVVRFTGIMWLASKAVAALSIGFVRLKRLLATSIFGAVILSLDYLYRKMVEAREEAEKWNSPSFREARQGGRRTLKPEPKTQPANVRGGTSGGSGGESGMTEAEAKSQAELERVLAILSGSGGGAAATTQATAAKVKESELKTLRLINAGMLKSDADFIQKRLELREQFTEAEKIADATERENALEAIRLKTGILDKEEAEAIKRRSIRRNEAQDEIELIKAEQNGMLDAEVDFMRRRQQIDREFKEAELIADDEMRELKKEKLRLLREQLIIDETEWRTERAMLMAELELELDEAEFEALRAKFQTRNEIEREIELEQALWRMEQRKKRIREELLEGKENAKLKAFFRRGDVQQFQHYTGALHSIAQAGGEKMKNIAKAADIALTLMKGWKNAAIVYGETLAANGGAPWGVPIATAAANEVKVRTLVAAAQIAAARQGALVQGNGRLGDRHPFLLEQGEIVVPRVNYSDVERGIAARLSEQQPDSENGTESGASGGRIEVDVELRGEAAEMFNTAIRKDSSMGAL